MPSASDSYRPGRPAGGALPDGSPHRDTPVAEAAGMVVTEINTQIKVADRAPVSDPPSEDDSGSLGRAR
jgi:hypothetical protein